jgi:5-methylcytosine-specific restriction endonuclease McrA
MSHRKPHKPIFYDQRVPGQCRYCGGEILDKKGQRSKRAMWHPACVAEYKLIHFPGDTRRAVFKRDKGKCAKCGVVTRYLRGAWDMDHIKPLIEAQGNLDYWRLPNLQTLCSPCHTAKTSAEATARAAARRAAKNIDSDTPDSAK